MDCEQPAVSAEQSEARARQPGARARQREATVDTVLGPVSAAELGVTQVHEHLLVDCRDPVDGTGRVGVGDVEPLALHNYYEARHRGDHQQSLVLDSVTDAIYEMERFVAAGGCTIVDVTPVCLGRQPEGLREIARATGVNVVMGCGYYVHEYHGPEVHEHSMEQLADAIRRDLVDGVPAATGGGDSAPIRAGVIGEIGLSWPLADCERKALVAASHAQRDTGKALIIHPGRHRFAPLEALDVVESCGVDPGRVVLSHLDRTLDDPRDIEALARRGAFVAFDLFGNESSFYPYSEFEMPNDGGRLRLIRSVVDAGFADRVLMSHDIYSKVHTTRYGGEGYAHILRRVVPLMARYGLDDEQQHQLLVTNPKMALGGPAAP